jgi:hypothetical protein
MVQINAAVRLLAATELAPYRPSTDRGIKVKVEPNGKVKFLNGYKAGGYMKAPNVKPELDQQFSTVEEAIDWLRFSGYTVVL